MRPPTLPLCLALCACSVTAPPTAPFPPEPTYRRVRDPQAGGIVWGPGGTAYAVVELLYRVDECSGAGGEHYVFAVDEGDGAAAAPRLAHGGGHAFYAALMPGTPVFHLAGRRAPERAAHFVAELQLLPPPTPFPPTAAPGLAPPPFAAGWCLDELPRSFSAAVLRVAPAADRHQARRLLDQAVERGMPASAVALQP